ncbi:MAG: hypothetical protein ACON39_07450 [Coraliomargaritaceae bacterium]
MKKRITKGISFPHEDVLNKGKDGAYALGLTSFSEYVNHLIRRDNGMPNIFDAIHEEPDLQVAEAKKSYPSVKKKTRKK